MTIIKNEQLADMAAAIAAGMLARAKSTPGLDYAPGKIHTGSLEHYAVASVTLAKMIALEITEPGALAGVRTRQYLEDGKNGN